MPTIYTCTKCGRHEVTIGRVDDRPFGWSGRVRAVDLVCTSCGHRGTAYCCGECGAPLRHDRSGAESEHYVCSHGHSASYSDR